MAKVLGLREIEAAFTKIAEQADVAARATVIEAAALVEAAAKANFQGSYARGRPHEGGERPNVVTGSLRRSIRHTKPVRTGIGSYTVTVGPSMIYGRRVELGFNGTDSRGRRYSQRPYPYFGPAVRQVQPRLVEVARRNWQKIYRF